MTKTNPPDALGVALIHAQSHAAWEEVHDGENMSCWWCDYIENDGEVRYEDEPDFDSAFARTRSHTEKKTEHVSAFEVEVYRFWDAVSTWALQERVDYLVEKIIEEWMGEVGCGRKKA